MATNPDKPKKPLLSGHKRRIARMAKEHGAGAALKEMKDTVAFERGLRMYGAIEAIQSTPKRKRKSSTVGTLDSELRGCNGRDKMISTVRDLTTNFSLTRGMQELHVDYTVGPGPILQLTTGDPDFDKRAEEFFADWSKPRNCDIRGVQGFGQYIRTSERSTVRDGDCGIILVGKGRGRGKLQGVEADRIGNPPNEKRNKDDQYIDGVQVDDNLVPKRYHTYRVGGNGLRRRNPKDYAAPVKPANFIHYFDPERFDQTRGISSYIAAINDMQDIKEVLEATKGAMKLENILGLVFTSDMANISNQSGMGVTTEYETNDAEGNEETRREVQIGQGAWTLDLLPGEDVKAIKKETPGSNFDPFMMFQIRLGALALKMPLELAFLFFTRGSFSSIKGAVSQYQARIETRQRLMLEPMLCDRIAFWRLSMAIKDEKLKGPEGIKLSQAHINWQWQRLPLLERDKEIEADVKEYKAGAATLRDLNARRSKDWEATNRQKMREIKRLNEMAEEEGILPEQLPLVLPQVTKPGEMQIAGNSQQ